LTCLAGSPVAAQQSIGLTEVDLIVFREATNYDWFAKLPKLSDKARRILLFEPGVVQVIATPTESWQYRGSIRILTVSLVEKADCDKLLGILTTSELNRLFRIISASPRLNGNTASMDFPSFYRKMGVELEESNKLPFTDADKARLRKTIGGVIADHPNKIQPNMVPETPGIDFKDLIETTKPRIDRWNKFLLDPTESPMAEKAGKVTVDRTVGQLRLLTAPDARTVHLEPIQNVPNVFKIELGAGQRLLLTVLPSVAKTQKQDLKPGEFADLLQSKNVSGFHLDTLSGDIVTVPGSEIRRSYMK
jgi:hypothetical protein